MPGLRISQPLHCSLDQKSETSRAEKQVGEHVFYELVRMYGAKTSVIVICVVLCKVHGVATLRTYKW